MNADIRNIITVLWRWSWLIVILALVAGVAAWQNERRAEPRYMSWITLQISSPDNAGISMMDEYSYRNDRDEVTVALNNFRMLLESYETWEFTAERLGFEPAYEMEVRSALDSDLVFVNVTADDPVLASQIAGARVEAAIAYFGEVRSRAARESYAHFRTQMEQNSVELQQAETDLTDFLAEHGLAGSLESEQELQTSILRQLENERNRLQIDGLLNDERRLGELDLSLLTIETNLQRQQIARLRLERDRLIALEGAEAAAEETTTEATTAEGEASSSTVTELDNALYEAEQMLQAMLLRQMETERVIREGEQERLGGEEGNTAVVNRLDTLIASQRSKLQTLVELQPEYNTLNANIRQLRDTTTLLNRKLTETAQKEAFASEVFFIQIIAGPSVPGTPISRNSILPILISVIAAVSLGVILAFGFEYVRHWRPTTQGPSEPQSAPVHSAQLDSAESS